MILYLPSFSQSSIGRQYYWGQRHGGVALAMDPWMFNVCAFVMRISSGRNLARLV